MTAPRAAGSAAAGSTTVTSGTAANVPAAPTPPAGARATPTTGIGPLHFVITRRRARQLVERAALHGLPLPALVREKAAPIPAEQPEGDTREPEQRISDPASIKATREALDSAAQQLDQEKAEREQAQTTETVHPLTHREDAAATEQHAAASDEEATRAGSRGKQQRASSTAKRAR